MNKIKLINRELSWLDFNERVLNEAEIKDLPLLDRLKFISIFSSNLDEFFMVRVAGLRQQVNSGKNIICPAGLTPKEQLEQIRIKVTNVCEKQGIFLKSILSGLKEKYSIDILSYKKLSKAGKIKCADFFEEKILPVLTPISVDPSHPFPVLKNGALEIAVLLKRKKNKKIKAFVEVPEILPRIIKFKEIDKKTDYKLSYILLEDIIINNLEKLFKGVKILDTIVFRITRDMDFEINEDLVSDLLVHIEEELKVRKRRDIIRLEIPKTKNTDLKKWLLSSLDVSEDFIYSTDTFLDLTFFMSLFLNPPDTKLVEEYWPPSHSPFFSETEPIFNSIKKHTFIPLFLPFQSFSPVLKLLEQAADDPDVLTIKQTLYRVSGDSPVIDALLRAAGNGKQVTVVVELKARFDEENNINWARKLEEAGAHVIYGMPKLKIHSKALLIIRKEKKSIARYLHLSTGNYNDKTAKLYTDIGYLTNHPDYCSDASAMFNNITGYSEFTKMNKFSLAPFDLRKKFISLIEREKRVSNKKNPGKIIAKMNSLVDPEIINAIYNAAEAGVKIDLIVRGICCLKSRKNINVVSIIDRHLEHSRIFYFQNAGADDFYLSSADWMPRNLDRRIEILFPVADDYSKNVLKNILEIQLKDKFKSYKMKSNGEYEKRLKASNISRSQLITNNYFLDLNKKANQKANRNK